MSELSDLRRDGNALREQLMRAIGAFIEKYPAMIVRVEANAHLEIGDASERDKAYEAVGAAGAREILCKMQVDIGFTAR